MAINLPINTQVGQPYIVSGSGIYYRADSSGRWTSSTAISSSTYIAESSVTKVDGNSILNYVELDNWRVRISPTGNRSLQISTVAAGNVTIDYTTFAITSQLFSAIYSNRSINPAWTYFENYSFNATGQFQEAYWTEQVSKKSYRVHMIVGPTFNNSTLNIQRLN
jgi:hypothetical protein